MTKKIFPEEHGDFRRTWVWAIPFLMLFMLIGGQLSVLLPAKIFGLVTRETVETYPTVLVLIIGTFAMIAVLLTIWIKFFERRSMASIGLLLNQGSKKLFVAGYGNGLLMGSAAVCGILLFGGYALEADTGGKARDLVPIAILMFAFILQSGTEEMLFRGWVMGRISERYGIWAGIIGNSLLFTLVHVEMDDISTTPPVMIALFTAMTLLFSIFLSLLTIRQKSIIGASAWHAAWNWIFITWFGLPTTGIELGLSPLIADLTPVADKAEWLTGGATGPEGSVMSLLVLVVACAVLLLKRRKSGPESDGPASGLEVG
jgi:membrane protease YdiL (CAAX protease family)